MTHVARCAIVALLFTPSFARADKVAAVVNGEPLAVSELDAALAQLPTPTAPLSAIQKRQRRLETLSILIDDKLVRQFLRQHGPKIEPLEVEKQLAALEASQKKQGRTVEDYLKEAGLTVAQIKENFRLMLQLARYIDSQATDERVRAFYEGNRDFFDKTTVRASHIVLRTAAVPMAERHKAVEKLRAVRADLAASKLDFASAAKAHSQCTSGPQGGDLGYIARKFQVDEAFARAAFSMKVGEVSEVVETDAGYHLIWVTDRKPGQASRFEAVTQDVRECFEVELKQSLLIELRKNARIEIKIKN